MAPISKLFLPPPDLSGCVLAGVYRNTRSAQLCDADRVNHFPATPLVCVTLVLHGTLHLVSAKQETAPPQDAPALPDCFVLGPQDTPVSSWSQDAIEAITIGIFPDTWHSIGGDMDFANVPASLRIALDQFAKATDPEIAWESYCTSLSKSWIKDRPTSWHSATGIRDWVKGIATRAALSGTGRSLRSMERRIKRYSGQTRRTLEFFSGFEQLQSVVLENPDAPLAQIAHDAGFSDQSHMGRAVRRATGFSPAKLNRAIQTEEAFWCYRLLGERF